eukprot:4976822-Amphidinium_carterae.1
MQTLSAQNADQRCTVQTFSEQMQITTPGATPLLTNTLLLSTFRQAPRETIAVHIQLRHSLHASRAFFWQGPI